MSYHSDTVSHHCKSKDLSRKMSLEFCRLQNKFLPNTTVFICQVIMDVRHVLSHKETA